MKHLKKLLTNYQAKRQADREFKRKADNLIDPTFLDRALEGENV